MHSTNNSSSTSSVSESSSESEAEKIHKSVRRNYLRTHATDNMRSTGIYNGAILSQYHRQQIVYHQQPYHQQVYRQPYQTQQYNHPYHQQTQQQQHFRHSIMQGYDNFAYSQCSSYVPNYYRQYSTHSNLSYAYPQQYLQPVNKTSNEYLPIKCVIPMIDEHGLKCVKREIPNSSYTYYDYQYFENMPVQAKSNRYSTCVPQNTEPSYQKNSTATSLNFDYRSQNNSLILNDVPKYEMTNNESPEQEQEQEKQTDEHPKLAVSENSLKFINFAAVGGNPNLSRSTHTIHKDTNNFEEKNTNDINDNLRKRDINFLNFDKQENKPKCTKKRLICLCAFIAIISVVILGLVFGTVYNSIKKPAQIMENKTANNDAANFTLDHSHSSKEIDFNLTDSHINWIKDGSLLKSQIQKASIQTERLNTNISSSIGMLEKVFDLKRATNATSTVKTTTQLMERTSEVEETSRFLTKTETTSKLIESTEEVPETKIETTSKLIESTSEATKTSTTSILTPYMRDDKTILTGFDDPDLKNSLVNYNDKTDDVITSKNETLINNEQSRLTEPTEKRQISNLKMSKKFKTLVNNILKHSKEN